MKEDKYFEEKISRALEAIKHPENFTDEELRKLLNDTKCLQACRDLLDGKEALARQNATAPDIEKEWSKFSSQHTTQKDIRHKGELNSPDGAPKGKTRNIDTFGRKLSVPAVKRMRFIGLSIVLIAASIALLFWLYAPAHSYYTVFEALTVAQEISIHTHEGKNLLTVPRGMNNQITLTDGTRIWLNAESQLEYPENFEGQEKRVVHLKGEAYFEVAKDTAHPFIVKTDLLETQVLGTSFNIRVYSPDNAHVTLLEGSIKVSDTHHTKELLIKPGQNATLQKGGTFSIHEVQAKEYSTWAEGQFYFDDTELIEIMRELGRWYNVNIIFTSKEAMHYRMHFQSDRGDSLPQVLNLLNSMQKVNAKFENDKVIVGL